MRGSRGARTGKEGAGWWDGEHRPAHIHRSFLLICPGIVFIRLITLNGMKASEELTEEQSRQVCASPCFITLLAHFIPFHFPLLVITRIQLLFDVDYAYAEFFRSLGGDKDV